MKKLNLVALALAAFLCAPPAWAAQIAGDLRASPPRIAPPREGLKLVIEIVAEDITELRAVEDKKPKK